MTRSRYIVEQEEPGRVIISDVGTVHMSVTNDAEARVLALILNDEKKRGMELFLSLMKKLDS